MINIARTMTSGLRSKTTGEQEVRAELLRAIDILNRWARGNGKRWAFEIYDAKNWVVRHAQGWRFRTGVSVTCGSCGGSGQWRYEDCWHCVDGKRLLSFLLLEIPVGPEPFEIIQWHTPRDRVTWMTKEEFDLLPMVPAGSWTPRQPGQDLDEAAGLALLMQVQQAVLEWRRSEA